jgi:hypothetical protein
MLRELDERISDGGKLRVRLFWDSETDRVFLRVEDDREPPRLWNKEIGRERVREAFAHPFAVV